MKFALADFEWRQKWIFIVTVNEMCSITHMTEELEEMNSVSSCNDPPYPFNLLQLREKKETRRWKFQPFCLRSFSCGQNYGHWKITDGKQDFLFYFCYFLSATQETLLKFDDLSKVSWSLEWAQNYHERMSNWINFSLYAVVIMLRLTA